MGHAPNTFQNGGIPSTKKNEKHKFDNYFVCPIAAPHTMIKHVGEHKQP